MTTMLEARDQYFRDNNFAADGGYGDKWVDIALGPVHVAIPNTSARVKAVRFHDLHHLVTGYRTDFVGEGEIAAWELAAGCKSMVAAWVLNAGALTIATFMAPRRMFKAFVRGRRSETFYGGDFDRLLTLSVDEGKALAKLDGPAPTPTVADGALFGASLTAGLLALPLGVVAGLLILPFGLAGLAAKKKAQAKTA